jgi:Leucine Rich repeat
LTRVPSCATRARRALQPTPAAPTGLAFPPETGPVFLLGISCAALEHLNIKNTSIGSDGLTHFNGLTTLKHLNLHGTPITDAGLANFKLCKETLNFIEVFNCKHVTDDGLVNFAGARNILWLELGITQVTDNGVLYFKDCLKIESIDLQQTKVTDACIDTLKRFSKAKNIGLLATNITLRRKNELQATLQGCVIDWQMK